MRVTYIIVGSRMTFIRWHPPGNMGIFHKVPNVQGVIAIIDEKILTQETAVDIPIVMCRGAYGV